MESVWITSWGIQCGDGWCPVDVYTQVVYYIDWIQNIMDQKIKLE